MKILMIFLLLVAGHHSFAQSLSKLPDSVRKVVDEYNGLKKAPANIVVTDDKIKSRLIKMALTNAEMLAADANIKMAEINRRKAGTSFLSSVNVGTNVNEFVINGSEAASFYPKYNIGLSIPLDMFAKNKAEKKLSDQIILIRKAEKDQLEKNIKARVLISYENYKEKKELVELQKIAMEDDLAAYERAQAQFRENDISLEDLNKVYKTSINERANLIIKEKDLNVAIIQLEELIAMPLQKALQN